MNAYLYHVMACEPCQVYIWSEIVNGALRRARETPVEAPERHVREVTGSR